MAFKKCRNEGCEIQIEVRNTAEGWRPYEESGNKHNCQFSDYGKKQRAIQEEQKNNHGNEIVQPLQPTEELAKPPYVDHTLAAPGKGFAKIKFFVGTKEEVEEEYNGFRYVSHGKITVFGTQLAVDNGIITFALNYEEIAEK